ncbi:MAG: archease [Abditibacteriales bacterium]|nr:archease [Abditibacteriales bacterium]MDW8364869.1 archease [Abditibacteriales bacterium]
MERFEFIEHTADVGIRAYGRTLSELFGNAALGMFSLIADLSQVTPTEDVTVEVEAADRESLLVAWLTELIYHYETKRLLFSEFFVQECSGTWLRGVARGQRFQPGEIEILRHMKAVTYHGLEVAEKDGVWTAQVIFDT